MYGKKEIRGNHIFSKKDWLWSCLFEYNLSHSFFRVINVVRIKTNIYQQIDDQFSFFKRGQPTLVTKPVPFRYHKRKRLLWESAQHIPHGSIFHACTIWVFKAPHIAMLTSRTRFTFICTVHFASGEKYDLSENSQKTASIEWADLSCGNMPALVIRVPSFL